MNDFSNISVVIPVREGSSRLENKIFLPFDKELNILEWKISQLKLVQSQNRIFLSSNSENVKSVAKNMGVEYLPRNDYLSVGHKASFTEVITGVVKDVPTDHFAWVTVVVPLMKPSEYKNAFLAYQKNVIGSNEFDSLLSVNSVKDYLWDNNGPVNYKADKNHTVSQDLPDLYRVTNGLYMRDKHHTLDEGYFLGPKPYMFEVGKVSAIDIDEYEDYQMALALKQFYVND